MLSSTAVVVKLLYWHDCCVNEETKPVGCLRLLTLMEKVNNNSMLHTVCSCTANSNLDAGEFYGHVSLVAAGRACVNKMAETHCLQVELTVLAWMTTSFTAMRLLMLCQPAHVVPNWEAVRERIACIRTYIRFWEAHSCCEVMYLLILQHLGLCCCCCCCCLTHPATLSQ